MLKRTRNLVFPSETPPSLPLAPTLSTSLHHGSLVGKRCRIVGKQRFPAVVPQLVRVQPAVELGSSTLPPSCQLLAEVSRRQAQERRRVSAQRLAGRSSSSRSSTSLTVLQGESVTPATQEKYRKVMCEFNVRTHARNMHPKSEAEFDEALTKTFDQMFLEGKDLGVAKTMMAALVYYNPFLHRQTGVKLPNARQALRGFQRLRPPCSRLPFPWEVICAVGHYLKNHLQEESALVLLLMFACYLRPSEPHKARVRDLVAPIGGSHFHRLWSLVLHPSELALPSKTHEFDEVVTLDLPQHHFIGEAIHARLVRTGRVQSPDLPLFEVTQLQVAHALRKALVATGLLDGGGAHPYRVRHGGASTDSFGQFRTLAEIQKRGRWRASTSVRRYEKGGRLTQIMKAYSPKLQQHTALCAEVIAEVMCSRRCPCPDP
jgi:hypothetical protein